MRLAALAHILEELAPRLGEIGEGLRVAVAVHVHEPRELLVLDGVELALERVGVGLLAGGVLPVPFGQRPIPDEACGTGSAPKVLALLRRRVQGNAVRELHQGSPGASCPGASCNLRR